MVERSYRRQGACNQIPPFLHAKLHPSRGLEGLVQPPCRLTHLNFRAYHLRLAFTSWTAPGSRRRILEVTLMDKKKLEGFKKRLETRQQDLRRTVSRTQADGRSADEDTAQDIADRAASSYTKEFLFSQSNNERQLLQMVEKALARIREGSFGECIHCGKEINAKRLEAVPWTRHCIECQEKLEQGLLEETSH